MGDRGARLAAEPSYGSIDFAARCGNGGNFYVYDGGQGGLFGRYAPGDRIEVVRNPQGRIDYVVNGEVRCTSQQAPIYPLHAKVCAFNAGTFVKDVQWVGAGHPQVTQERFETLILEDRNLYVALATAQSRNDTLLAEVWQQLLAREECRRLAPNFVRSSEATTSASPTAG